MLVLLLFFISGFIQVQTNKKSILMHHKFCIIDGPKAIKRKAKLRAYAEKLNIYTQPSEINMQSKRPPKAFVMSGSLNWSTQAMITNYENIIVTSNSSIVNKFENEFGCLWDETEPVSCIISSKFNSKNYFGVPINKHFSMKFLASYVAYYKMY